MFHYKLLIHALFYCVCQIYFVENDWYMAHLQEEIQRMQKLVVKKPQMRKKQVS